MHDTDTQVKAAGAPPPPHQDADRAPARDAYRVVRWAEVDDRTSGA